MSSTSLIGYMWENENPARELLLAHRVYLIGSKAVWLIEEIPAREFLLAQRVYLIGSKAVWLIEDFRLVSFYWPTECT